MVILDEIEIEIARDSGNPNINENILRSLVIKVTTCKGEQIIYYGSHHHRGRLLLLDLHRPTDISKINIKRNDGEFIKIKFRYLLLLDFTEVNSGDFILEKGEEIDFKLTCSSELKHRSRYRK